MLINGSEYLAVLTDVKSQIEAARRATVRAMNTGLVVLYWNIGRVIDERSEWGNKFLETLARDIRCAYPGIRGFSVRNLKYMLRFAREYPDLEKVQPLVAQLPWASHIVLLDKVRDPLARSWYVKEAADNPTIGLLLCKYKGGLVAEYAFKNINKPIGVSEYELLETLPERYEDLLPSVEDIRTHMSLPEDEGEN